MRLTITPLLRRTARWAVGLAACAIAAGAQANDIDPDVENYTANKAPGTVVIDGDLSEWAGLPSVANPRTAPSANAAIVPATEGGLSSFELLGGTWDGPADHTIESVQVTWDDDNVYLGVVVTDDYHENAANSAWNGDALQVHLANGARDTQQGLNNVFLGGVEGALGEIGVNVEAGPEGTVGVVVRDGTTTTYEVQFPKAVFALETLEAGVQVGIGFTVNDGDELEPGQKGWSGWGPHAVVDGKTPSETALVTLGAAAAVFEQVWTVGLPGDGWPQDGTGGGAATVFVQEAAVNDLPGDPASPVVNQESDDDYYFAGVYDTVLDGGAYTPIGAVAENETGAERAFAGLDNSLRYHFNFPSTIGAGTPLSISWDANNLHTGDDVPDSRYGLEVYVNGVLVGEETVVRPDLLGVINTTPNFTLSDVNGMVGEGFDNYVELRGVNYNADGGGNWMGIDHVSLAAGPDVASPVGEPITSPADPVLLVNGTNDDDGDAGAPPAAEGEANATDGTTNKYLNFLDLGSGFVVTPAAPSSIGGARFYTANDVAERDPASYVIEGSNSADGPWTVVAEGALDLPLDRNASGQAISTDLAHQEVSFAATAEYASFRVTFPTLRDAGATNSMQIAEVELLGAEAPVAAGPDPALVACWDFQTPETSEPTTTDIIGGYEGMLVGSAELTRPGEGVTGQPGDIALDLVSAGSSLMVDAAFSNAIMATDTVTVTFWQKLRVVQNQMNFKFRSPSSNGGERGWSVHAPWSNNIIYFDSVGCCDAAMRISEAAPEGLDFAAWNHFAFVKNGGTKEIYVNGELFASGEGASPLPTDMTQLFIGSGVNGEGAVELSMDGLLDEFRIFNEALDAERIMASMAFKPINDPVLTGAAALLKLHYEFEEGTGNLVKNLAPPIGGGGGGGANPAPIAHWPLDEINAEGLSPDVAGSRHMTAVNLTADDVVEGAAGNAISFDNARETLLEYIAEEGQATATSNAAYTISLWTKIKGTGQNDFRIFSEASTTSNSPLFNLGTANNGDDDSLDLYLRTQDNGNPYNHARTTGMPLDDTWHHIAFTQEAGGQISVYIDGVLDAIDTATLLPEFGGGINTTSIGGIRRAAASHWVTGLIDDVKIFDVSLTAEQIAFEIANPGAPDPDAAPAEAGTVTDGTLLTTNAAPWKALTEETTTSVGGPGYLFFDDADRADATYVDTNLTPADLGIAEAPYTMMARVRQDVIGDGDSGDSMIFGQASGNVLHNGARGDQLHIGHWGSDLTGGSVSLGQWRHVAYVFNGSEEIIYVNGVEVARQGDKVGLTSDGRSADTILIGTTRLDQDRDFEGCLDDVRIYCGALDAAEIEAIACESPNSDCDGDGISDAVELAVFGTLDRDGTGDLDGDRINDATEIALGTNADERDSDGDGLWDGAETLAWCTDPLNPDTDGDGLTDGAEVTLHGTDPKTDDTDRDGIADGDELANGPSSTVLDFETDPGLEIINFGADGIAPEIRAEGGNPDGYLSLTDAVNGARATVIFPDTTGGSNIAGFKFSVDARIGGGTDRPADGLSISLVRPTDPVLQDPRGSTFAGTIDLGATEESLPEEGSRTGVSVGFDAWESGGSDLVGFSVRVDGELITQIPAGVLNGELTDPLSLQTGPQAAGDDNLANLGWARFEINLDADGTLDVTWKGSTLVDNVQTAWTPSPGQLVFAARTGGANQAHHFDNLELAVIPEGSADPLVFNEGAVAAGQKVYYEFDDFDALPSPEAASFVAADASAAGAPGLSGQYWALAPKAFESVGATAGLPLHRAGDGAEGEDNANSGFADSLMAANPVPSGTFVATDLNYTGDDLTPIADWLAADGASYEGDTSETAILGDALMRFTGYLWVDAAGDRTFSTNSDDGSVVYINNEVVVHHDNGHGQNGEDPLPAPQLATINFPEAGFYPVDIRYFNGDWTDDAGAHGGANFATVGLDPATLFQSVEGAGANVVTNLGVGNDGTLVGASLADAASVQLGDPTMTWTEVGQIPSINNQFDGADQLDATFRALIDFDAKTEGNAENIWESGGATIGSSFVYEAPSTLALRTVGIGGNAVLTAKAALSEADLAGGPLEVLWTIDVNAAGPEVGSIWINGEPRVSVSFEKGNDWSGGDAMNILSGTPNISAGGGNSNLPGGSSAFASGTVDLTVGIQFYRDTLFNKGILSLNGDGTVYVDTNHTAAETGAGTENYTMLARIQANDLAGDNMIFGQAAGNVLHNGLRDANFHQGHWGNDTNGGTAEIGQWYNVAWRYTAGTQTIFVDGEPVVAGSMKGLLGELGNILVGATRLDQDRSFNGSIDYAQIYCRALSHEVIKSIQGKSLELDSDLIVHYEFEHGISMTVQNTGNSGAPDGSLNSLDVISAYGSGSPSTGGPGVMSFDTTGGTDATYIDTGLTGTEASINGAVSYTMMSWIKPTNDAAGDQMFFGQGEGNVLHNGIRDRRLHIGHWGNDTGSGASPVTYNQWQHVAFVYDSAAMTQTIYINGEVTETAGEKGALGNDGNLLIGTTRFDQDRDYTGLLDDVRVYGSVLNGSQITAIAGIGDSDGDGVDDAFERAFFGNLAMNGAGDPDGDGINNADEERLGLDPTMSDAQFSDADNDGWTLGDETLFETNPDNADSFPSLFVGGGQWEVRVVQAEGTVAGLAGADALLSGEAPNISDVTSFHDFINFGAGAQGSVGGDSPFPEGAAEHFATHSKADIEVTTTGDYWLSFSTDDGMRIIIDGEIVAEVDGGRGAPALDGNAPAVRLTAGRHTVELIQYEQTGGDAAEFAGTITSENSLNGLGGSTVVLIPATAPEASGAPITSINFLGAQGADAAAGTPMSSNEVTGVVAANTWNNLGPTPASAEAILPSGIEFDFETDIEGLELINIGTGGMPEVRSEGGNPGGYLSLTDAVNSANASIIFPDLTGGQSIAGFSFSVDARIGGGTDRPADGMSVNLVRPEDPLLAADTRGAGYAAGVPEEGSTTGLGIGFDAWDNGDGIDVIGFSVRVDGELIEQVEAPTLNGALDDVTSLQTGDRGPDGAGDISALGWARFEVVLSPTGELSVSWKGTEVISGLQTGWAPSAGQLVFGARTGGANQAHHFDNLALSVVPAGAIVDNQGHANGIGVTWQANTMWTTFAPGAATDPTAKMMDGYIDDTADMIDGSDYSFVNLAGIPYASYDVVAYFTSDGNDRSGAARINGGDDTFLLTAGNNDPIAFTQATATAEADAVGATYVWWQGLSGPEALVEWRRISNNVGLAGIQIIDTSVGAEPSPLADGLIGYWPFEGDLDDQAGDSHGTGVGDPIEFAAGQFGQGIDLNGANHVVTPVENEEMFDFPEGNFSVSAWFRVDTFDKGWQALVTKGEGSNWRIHRRAETDHLGPVAGPQEGNATAGADMVDGPDVNDGAIHHVIITNGPDGAAYYLDGVLAGTAPAGGTQGNEWPMMIGENANNGGNGRTWNGLIDDVAVWNRGLSEDEVALIYNGPSIGDQIAAGAGGDSGIAGLLGYWPDEFVSTADNHLDLGTLPVLTLESDFAWSFWVNSEVTGNNNTVLGNRYMSDGTDFDPREFIKFTPSAFEWHVNGAGENVTDAATTGFPIGEWAHNLVVKEGATLTYYRNGAVISSGDITGAPANAQPLYLGGVPGPDGATLEGFVGTIMEVATFDRALSADDVADVYNRGLNGESLAGGGPDPRAAAVAQSSGALTSPTLVDFGALEGDSSYEFSFNAVKAGASTALAGNASWGLKLDQWQDSGFIGTTEFGVADNLSEVPAIFGEDAHVVFTVDATAGVTSIYINGALAGTVAGNAPLLPGEVTVMGATRDPDPIDVFGEGSVMHGWATYNTALSADEVAALAAAPFAVGEPSGPAPLNIVFVSFHDSDAPSAAAEGAGFTEASDKGYTDLLAANGHTVTRWLTRNDPTADDAAALNSFDLVIISRAVNSGQYNEEAEFWNTMVTVPVMNLGGYTFRNSRLNWTDGGVMVDADGPITLAVADTAHPIFAGVDVSGPYANGLLEGQRGLSFNNNMVVGGTLLASAADTSVMDAPAIFEFAAGATVNNGNVLAAPRLAFLTGSREGEGISSETAGIYDLTASGEQMFLNAVNYIGSGTGAAQVTSVKELVDSDNDGVANLLEAIAGTNANDPSDYFHISSIKTSDAGLMISFDGVEGLAYDIEFSENLGSWEVIGSQTTGETTAIEFLHEERPAGQGFYRARVVQD